MAIPAGQCEQQLTALAFEEGNIQAVTERKLMESAHPLMARIKQGTFKTGIGSSPRKIRYSIAPTENREYLDLNTELADEAADLPGRGLDGKNSDLTTTANGRQDVDIPGETLYHGYDEFGRQSFIKAFETNPFNLMSLLQQGPEHLAGLKTMLRDALPKVAREQYEQKLEDVTIANGKYNFPAITNVFTHGDGTWNAKPTSGLTLELVKRAAAIIKAEGWNGKFEVMTSVDAFERMRENYKTSKSLELESTQQDPSTHLLPDGTSVVEWGNIRWVLLDRPPRGYIEGGKFHRIYDKIARVGTGAGVVWDINPDYFNCRTTFGGGTRELYEIGYFIDPSASERQAFAPANKVLGKGFENNIFNMAVRMLSGNDLECNKDRFKFSFRLLHAWGYESCNPELMGSFIYKVAPDVIGGFDPGCNDATATADPFDPAGGAPTEHDECSLASFENDGSCPEGDLQHAVQDTGAGVFRLYLAETVKNDAGTLTVAVERIGGNDGVATVNADTVDGTATAGDDYTAVVDETLSWADGEAGRKTFEITIAADADDGQVFDVTLDTAVGGTVESGSASQSVTIEAV